MLTLGRLSGSRRGRLAFTVAPALPAWILAAALAIAGCSPASPGGGQPADGQAAARRSEPRTMVVFVRVEPVGVAARILQSAGTALHMSRRLFNALPALIDDRGLPRPYLLEGLAELNTPSWQVFPDGRMQSTYVFKPSATWHDGTPLTAEDFVFAWQVYSTPELGQANAPPFFAVEEAVALDARTFTVKWKLPYAGAQSISARDKEWPALPRHILGAAFEQMPVAGQDVLTSHPYWSREYVGLGPYRMERWEPGAFIEAVGFDGHVLGAPRIERVRLRFSADGNVVLANLLAGEAHAATDNSVGQVAETLQREWAPRNGGSLIQWPNAWRHTLFQLRPELATPRAILDARVRKALGHAIDKQAISDAVYGGQGILAESMIWSGSEWGAALGPTLMTYPYDLRRSEQLMAEAGFVKGAEGIFTSPSEGRFSPEMMTTEGPDNVPEVLIMAAGFREAGFDARESVMRAALAQDIQARSTFSGMFTSNTNMGEPALINLVTDDIPSPQTRWRGSNRGAWSNPRYDELIERFNRTLGRDERLQLVTEALRIYSEELPAISLFFRAQPFAYVAGIRGPGRAAPESAVPWNIHEWQFD